MLNKKGKTMNSKNLYYMLILKSSKTIIAELTLKQEKQIADLYSKENAPDGSYDGQFTDISGKVWNYSDVEKIEQAPNEMTIDSCSSVSDDKIPCINKQGLIYYPVFNNEKHIKEFFDIYKNTKYYISIDYGTINPFSAGLWALYIENDKQIYHRIDEFYYSARIQGKQLTDSEYYEEIIKLANGRKIESLIIEPSAASFIQTVKNKNVFNVINSYDDICYGICRVESLLQSEQILISPKCKNILEEIYNYRWGCNGKPERKNDRAMDDMRFFISTIKE